MRAVFSSWEITSVNEKDATKMPACIHSAYFMLGRVERCALFSVSGK